MVTARGGQSLFPMTRGRVYALILQNAGGEIMSEEISETTMVPVAAAPYRTASLVRTAPEAPVIFADGITNHIMGAGVSKFHFYRTDAVAGKLNVYEKVEVAQIIMPAESFVDMVAFFEHRWRVMLKHGNVTQAHVDERRAFYSAYPV
jgi:hypothetical protein